MSVSVVGEIHQSGMSISFFSCKEITKRVEKSKVVPFKPHPNFSPSICNFIA